MGCVYMRTAPSGKSYIGQTIKSEIERWKEHCSVAYLEGSSCYHYPLSRAIRKYGKENFECTILEDNIFDVNLLHELEMFWISYYDTFNTGLNATIGGDGNAIYDPNKTIELWEQGYCVRDICLLLNISSGAALRHLGKTSAECKYRGPVYESKNLEKYLQNRNIGKSVCISCFDMTTGEYIKTFHSYYEAKIALNVNSSSPIMRAVNGQTKSAYGYYWRKGNSTNKLSDICFKNLDIRNKPIKKYVVCEETNTMYENASCADKLTHICYRSILEACKGYQKTAGGLHWHFALPQDVNTLTLIKLPKEYKPAHNTRPVLCVETGVVYISLKEAGKATGVSNSAIYNCCSGKTETSGGFHWQYNELRKD